MNEKNRKLWEEAEKEGVKRIKDIQTDGKNERDTDVLKR